MCEINKLQQKISSCHEISLEDQFLQKPRIGILGGSFNPPHLGHMQMAVEAINLGYIDEVWIVPCGDRKDKKITISGQIRLQMVNMLVKEFFANEFPVKVCDIEIENGQQIPTYYLMKKFQEIYGNLYEFYFIMGSDLLDTLHLWNEADKLKNEISFLIYRRSHQNIHSELLPKNYILINTTFVASSSSEIRNRIKNYCKMDNQSEKKTFMEKYMGVYGILPFSLINFIKEEGLYLEIN